MKAAGGNCPLVFHGSSKARCEFEQMSPVTGSDFSYPNPLLRRQFQRRTSPFSCFFFCKQGRINKSEPNRSLQKKRYIGA
uniref:Bm1652 n=1 Tax=Brugia malayi TaxID=6279 RepID=A0A1I9G689_BRUMA|nr:Bm1652 [Brugia malayi]